MAKIKTTKKKTPRASKVAVTEPISEQEIEAWIDADDPEQGQVTTSGEAAENKYARSQLRVIRESKDFTLDYLQHALQAGNYIINVSPEYQRRQRWSSSKRSLLIESFLLNIPIPPVFLFEREYNSYEVIDGRQRLDTIRDFLDDRFPLRGLRFWPELNGKKYSKLPSVIQSGLLRRSIGAIVLLAETRRPVDDEVDVRTLLFDRLNTGGEKLNPQELRNALYPGTFNRLLIDCARSDVFTRVWGIPKRTKKEEREIPAELARNTLYRTMADCELVLRFFAIREALTTGNRGSLRRLLDRSMDRHKDASQGEIQALKGLFEESLHALVGIFDGRTFHLPNQRRPSRPLYDSLMVAHSLNHETRKLRRPDSVKRELNSALANPAKYDILVGRGNTIDAVMQRVRLASRILFVGR